MKKIKNKLTQIYITENKRTNQFRKTNVAKMCLHFPPAPAIQEHFAETFVSLLISSSFISIWCTCCTWKDDWQSAAICMHYLLFVSFKPHTIMWFALYTCSPSTKGLLESPKYLTISLIFISNCLFFIIDKFCHVCTLLSV